MRSKSSKDFTATLYSSGESGEKVLQIALCFVGVLCDFHFHSPPPPPHPHFLQPPKLRDSTMLESPYLYMYIMYFHVCICVIVLICFSLPFVAEGYICVF